MDVKERWSELCLDEGVERLILERIKRRGLSDQLCGLVRREVENPEVQERHVERAIYSSFSALGRHGTAFSSPWLWSSGRASPKAI